jgi:hypothetical protein|tara:strand:- start:352 stop:537 length:186 start_codon:yes stop_codon:yes gene_type:complete
MSKSKVKAKVVNTDWRDHPASFKQLLLINKSLLEGTMTGRVTLPLTKGQAFDLIDKAAKSA